MAYPLWEMKDTTNAYLGLFWILCRYKHFLCPKCFSGFLFLLLYLHLVLFLFRFWRIFLFKINCFENEKNKVSFVLAWSTVWMERGTWWRCSTPAWSPSPVTAQQGSTPTTCNRFNEYQNGRKWWLLKYQFKFCNCNNCITMLNIIAILGWRPTSLLNCGIPRACSTSPLFY